MAEEIQSIETKYLSQVQLLQDELRNLREQVSKRVDTKLLHQVVGSHAALKQLYNNLVYYAMTSMDDLTSDMNASTKIIVGRLE